MIIEAIGFRWRLALLQRERSKKEQIYRKLRNELRKNPDKLSMKEIQSSFSEIAEFEWDEMSNIDGEILQLESQRLAKLAEGYLLPRPKSASWITSEMTGHRFLDSEALIELRGSIRQEKRERREHVLGWCVPVITMLTGLIGAISGLVAIIRMG